MTAHMQDYTYACSILWLHQLSGNTRNVNFFQLQLKEAHLTAKE